MIVEDLGRQPERGLAAAEVYVDAVARHGHRPEDAVRVDVGIVVVNLVWSNWTVEDVQSDETERRLIVLAVLGDVDAIWKPMSTWNVSGPSRGSIQSRECG